MTIQHMQTIKDVMKHPDIFRVSIFGSARTKPGDPEYDGTFDLSYKLGKEDITVITGGGPGQMLAANEGHRKAESKGSNSIGLTIELPWEPEKNKELDVHRHFEHFGARLDAFMTLSNVIVVSAGGIGTALELFYAWQLTQVKHMCKTPIILMDPMWHHIPKLLKEQHLARGYVSEGDFDNIYCVNNEEEALELILEFKEKFKEIGDDMCLNLKKYKGIK